MGYPEGLFPNLVLVGMVKLLLNGDEKEVLSICPQHRVWGAKLFLVSCLAWQALPYIVLCWEVNSRESQPPSIGYSGSVCPARVCCMQQESLCLGLCSQRKTLSLGLQRLLLHFFTM